MPNITGTLTKEGADWTLEDKDTGKKYTLTGQDFPARVEGQTVRVVGPEEDSFGGGLFGDSVPIVVQRWNVV